jgi:hypothetical protein
VSCLLPEALNRETITDSLADAWNCSLNSPPTTGFDSIFSLCETDILQSWNNRKTT